MSVMTQMLMVGMIEHLVIHLHSRVYGIRAPLHRMIQTSRYLQGTVHCFSPIYKNGIWAPYRFPMIRMEMRFKRFEWNRVESQQRMIIHGLFPMAERSTNSEQIPSIPIPMETCFPIGGSTTKVGTNQMTIGPPSYTLRSCGKISEQRRNH